MNLQKLGASILLIIVTYVGAYFLLMIRDVGAYALDGTKSYRSAYRFCHQFQYGSSITLLLPEQHWVNRIFAPMDALWYPLRDRVSGRAVNEDVERPRSHVISVPSPD